MNRINQNYFDQNDFYLETKQRQQNKTKHKNKTKTKQSKFILMIMRMEMIAAYDKSYHYISFSVPFINCHRHWSLSSL